MNNHQRRPFLIAALVAAVFTSGCVFHVSTGDHDDDGYYQDSVERRDSRQREQIARLNLGADALDVVDQLGAPDFSDQLQTSQGVVRVLRYRTQRVHADGETTRDETTPLVFRDGKLIGTGVLALEKVLKD